jgi:hypothetical protein
MTWSWIDPGSTVSTGSWFQGCLWSELNKFLIFGNRNGNLVDDYHRHLLSWDHVAVIDLEALGIYQPPPIQLDISMQELGLAALEEDILSHLRSHAMMDPRLDVLDSCLKIVGHGSRNRDHCLSKKAKGALEALLTSLTRVPSPSTPSVIPSEENRPDLRLTPVPSIFLNHIL